jgi:LysR family transcriptional regulator, glycine cleavage system transcriptional activator
MEAHRTPRLSLDLLRGFRSAARHLSFTRAAQELFVTQSAISREIAKLEEQLRQPLFRRVNRTLQLTQAGQELYRAVDEALALIDSATQRLVGSSSTLAVTIPVPLASLWLGPRLQSFTQAHPEVDMRVSASNDTLDLPREQIDIAIRYVANGSVAPSHDKLFDLETVPVCSPVLARDGTRPIRTPADLSQHVLLDFETARNGRAWFDWQLWFDAMNIRGVKAAGSLRFSHYDQVVQAAVEGSGVAIGKRPHLARHLRDGTLVAPLGDRSIATLGSFYVVVSERVERDIADAFVAWLHNEAAAL